MAFTRLFKQPLKGVTRRYYHIGGSWENPTVDRIDKYVAKQDTDEVDAVVTEAATDDSAGETSTPPTDTDPEQR